MPATPTEPADLRLYLRVLNDDFRLEFDRPESRDRMARLWSRCVTEPREGEGVHVVQVGEGDEPLGPAQMAGLGTRIAEEAIAEIGPDLLVLRASAVADDQGSVLIIAGGTGSSAEAALRGLARSGLAYVSAGLVAVRGDGSVVAYPAPIPLVAGSGRESEAVSGSVAELAGPDDLGLARCPEVLTLGAIVLLDDGDPTGPSNPEPVSLIDALTALAPLVATGPARGRYLPDLCRLLERCGVPVGLRAQPDAVDPAVFGAALSAAPVAPEPWSPIDVPVGANAMAWRIRDGKVRRSPFEDGVEVDGEAVVVAGGRPLRLGPLGGTLWRAAASGATFGALEESAVAAHGWHPDATALVREALVAMRDAGAVGWGAPATIDDVLAGLVAL